MIHDVYRRALKPRAVGEYVGMKDASAVFVNIARTAFIYLPAMLAVVLIRYARGWYSPAIIPAIGMLAAGAWAISPNLQSKMTRLLAEVDALPLASTNA